MHRGQKRTKALLLILPYKWVPLERASEGNWSDREWSAWWDSVFTRRSIRKVGSYVNNCKPEEFETQGTLFSFLMYLLEESLFLYLNFARSWLNSVQEIFCTLKFKCIINWLQGAEKYPLPKPLILLAQQKPLASRFLKGFSRCPDRTYNPDG